MMTYKKVFLVQCLLYYCVTICLAQYHSNKYYPNVQYYRSRNINISAPKASRVLTSQMKKVNITVYYETLCPASVVYFTQRLRPAVDRLGPHLDIHLVPYGHAQTIITKHNRYKFRCQHGPPECYGNRVHACAIDIIRNNTISFLFNACLMENTRNTNGFGYDYQYSVNLCSNQMNISLKDIHSCLNTGRGVMLQKRFGEETQQLRLDYVPYVLIDSVEDDQNESLLTVICRKLKHMRSDVPTCREYGNFL